MGLSDDVVSWREFLPSLVAQGIRGVKLVIGDAHPSLKQAVREVFPGTTWQRFPNHRAVLCLFGALLAAQSDEWSVADHRYMNETSMRKRVIQEEEEVPAQLVQWTA